MSDQPASRHPYRPLRECRICHRVGYLQFNIAGQEEWECRNDRACSNRAAARNAASPLRPDGAE